MDLYIGNDMTSWEEIVKTLEEYELNSGMKVNYDKTTVYRMGSIRNTNAKFYSSRKINCSNGLVNILGVILTNDSEELVELNIRPLIKEMSNLLRVWRARGLTLQGKIMVVNSLAASKLAYRLSVLPFLTTALVKEIKDLFNAFIWNDKKPKIRYEVVTGLKTEGGLGLFNVQKKDITFKLGWPFKIQASKFLKHTVYVLMGNPCGDLIWQTNLTPQYVDRMFPKRNVWTEVLKKWSELHFEKPVYASQVKKEILWYNANIKIANTPVFEKNWHKAGINRVEDLLKEDGTFCNVKEISNKYECKIDYLFYYGLIKAIPVEWKRWMKEDSKGENHDLFSRWQPCKNVVNLLYRKILGEPDLLKSYRLKWAEKLKEDIVMEDYIRHVVSINKFTLCTKLRSFQYKLMARALELNPKLRYYKLREDDKCTLCGDEVETYRHLFSECPEVKGIWDYVVRICELEEKLSTREILFNEIHKNPRRVENFVVLLAKRHIYVACCKKVLPNVILLREQIKENEQIEKTIAYTNNKSATHNLKWKELIEKL